MCDVVQSGPDPWRVVVSNHLTVGHKPKRTVGDKNSWYTLHEQYANVYLVNDYMTALLFSNNMGYVYNNLLQLKQA